MLRKNLWLLLLASLLLTSCGSGQLFGTTITSTSTVTSIPSVTPTVTVTLTPTATTTPTPEIAKPSIPNGLRYENATTQVLENGTWVVRNTDGKVTATWNAETKQWDYVAENIKVEQIIIGYTGDVEAIKPYLGPLPPDDPATHFKNADGTPVGYGIGPEEVTLHMVGSVGHITYSATEAILRFRGIAPLPIESRYSFSAMIFELPRSADTSLILVIEIDNDVFSFDGTLGDSAVWNPKSRLYSTLWIQDSGIKLANDHLIGSSVILLVSTNKSSQINPENSLYNSYVQSDKFAQALLDYIQGKSTQLPVANELSQNSSIQPRITFPQTVLLGVPIK